jgi:hypothetical protein
VRRLSIYELRVVTVEEWPLHSATAVGVPEHRHHVSEVIGRGIDAPVFPID